MLIHNQAATLPRLRQLLFISSLSMLLSACVATPSNPKQGQQNQQRQQVVRTALSLQGKPYHYGGQTPQQGFDCSGLVRYSFAQNGIQLPRTSYEQYRRSEAISRSRLKLGDLVFFRLGGKTVSHVGIYIGNNEFVHAPGRGRAVTTENLDAPYWQTTYVGAGSVLN
ncbi:MAG: C40 family peptidase [Gammaproteobacteria bacterium]|nr:C40 family peptidase [Gammaproteobacteria bacterium]